MEETKTPIRYVKVREARYKQLLRCEEALSLLRPCAYKIWQTIKQRFDDNKHFQSNRKAD